jgi:hypothetical protein
MCVLMRVGSAGASLVFWAEVNSPSVTDPSAGPVC